MLDRSCPMTSHSAQADILMPRKVSLTSAHALSTPRLESRLRFRREALRLLQEQQYYEEQQELEEGDIPYLIKVLKI
ncbi:hypothetical protein NDU88_004350 [Pleurodeles waltl]|uniref:Uncharacterized protein n=1 Tax=Pleurodeles waltl TaxID=8319 RepID=A0AAV7NJJ1_PLEWA|nr:hypothetical protein NDU88_004350 [Pleurodeles waltl]